MTNDLLRVAQFAKLFSLLYHNILNCRFVIEIMVLFKSKIYFISSKKQRKSEEYVPKINVLHLVRIEYFFFFFSISITILICRNLQMPSFKDNFSIIGF